MQMDWGAEMISQTLFHILMTTIEHEEGHEGLSSLGLPVEWCCKDKWTKLVLEDEIQFNEVRELLLRSLDIAPNSHIDPFIPALYSVKLAYA